MNMKKFLTLCTALLLFGSMTVVQATDYYYRGNQNSWSAAIKMTPSTDGYYAYFSAQGYSTLGSINEFKISLTADSWDYNCSIASPGFNGTDITNMNSSSNSWNNDSWNNAIYHPSDFYILVYFPNTTINSSSSPVMCASTTLPDNSAPSVYTVVGDVPGLGWTPENTDLDMTETDGVYTFEMTGVELAVGTYEYKIAKNHSWAVTYPQEGNTSFSITTAGIYDLTFTLDLSASPEYSVTPTLKEEIVVIPAVKMYGTFADGSTWGDTQEFTIAGNNESASLTLENLPVGNYTFKVVVGSSYRGNGHIFYRDYIGAKNIGTGDDMTLEADVAGDYTFTWTYENDSLGIDFPAEPTPEYVDIKFFAPRDETNKWEHVYAYSYKGSRKFLGVWPGTEITSTKDAGWYTVSVRKGSNLIFTDNAGMETNAIENVQADACYESTSIYYPEDPAEAKKVTVTANASCAVTYHIAGSKNLIDGEAEGGFDVNLPLDENNQIIFHDVEPGTYAFKINNNSWAWSIGGIDHMKEGECASIAQEVGVGDLGFKIDTKQDVTVTYYPATQEICLGAVTVKATTTVEGADMNIKAGESKKLAFSTNNTENPGVTYTILSGSEYIGMFQNVITGIKEGTTTVRVSLAETANYTAASDEFTITVSNPVAPAKAIEAIGGKFIINAKGDTAVFSRGNLKYNVATGEWYCAEKQYDFVGEGGNLHFGDANYTGEYDLFGWSCTASNYGLMQSNHDEVYTGAFVDWGGLFTGGEQEWATPTGSELYYIINHHQWTIMGLDPTPENADNEDEIYGLAIFPLGWAQPEGFDDLTYSYSNWWDEETKAKNTFALSKWDELEAAGAVFLPHAGARAGHWGNTWNGKEESAVKNPNPNGGQSYCFVDNIGWYGYYWSSITDPRSEHPYDAQYLITPGWSEGPTLADEDDLYLPPVVWSREKRRGNTVRLITRIPREQVTIRENLEAGRYYTLCYGKTISSEIEGATFWRFASKDASFAYLVQEDAPYAAGKPYIIYAEAAALKAFVENDDAHAGQNGALHGTFEKLYQADFDAAGENIYIVKDNQLRKVSGQSGNTLAAGRAYVNLDEIPSGTPNNVPAHRVRKMPMQQEVATGFESIQTSENNIKKVVIDGQLFIIRGEMMYNANGVRVQ